MTSWGLFAGGVGIRGEGVALAWRWWCPEARYSGRFIRWSEVQDADPDAYPPELRLTNGRTVFIPREHHEELATAVAAAGVTVRARFDVWADLLEPFLDTEYDEESRTRCEGRLHSCGFTDQEIRSIRRRVSGRMWAMTLVTWEWAGYGHSDVLLATSSVPGFFYRRFRAWADAIAARGGTASS